MAINSDRKLNVAGQSGRALPRLAILLVVSLLSLALIFWLGDFRFDGRSVDWSYFLLGFLAFMGNYVVRTARFRTLAGTRPPLASLWSITAAHGVLNYLVPARLGELSLPVFARYVRDFPPSVAVAGLVASRGLDIAIVVLAVIIAAVTGLVPLPEQVLHLQSLLLFLAAGLVLVHGWRTGWLRGLVGGITRRFPRVHAVLQRIFSQLESLERRQLYVALVQTLFIWCLIWVNFYCIARAVGCPLDLIGAMAISIILIPLSLLPTQGFANLGTYEAAWVLVLAGGGASTARAVEWAVATHILLTFHVVLLGAFAAIAWWLTGRHREFPDAAE